MYLNVDTMPEAMWYKCYVDGVQLHTCFEANEEEGWARYFDAEEVEMPPLEGRPLLNWRIKLNPDGEFIRLEKHGKVELVSMKANNNDPDTRTP